MRSLLTPLLISVFLFSCSTTSERNRPREAWVIRSVLDQQPRIISIALYDNLWVAYSTQFGSLFKAWTGGINFDGPVYTSAHGPQPTTQGATYLEEAVTNPWRVIINGKSLTPTVIYKGHRIANDQATLNYILDANGTKISVAETPEYAGGSNGKTSFERVFVVSGLSEGSVLNLGMRVNSVVAADDIDASGFTVENTSEETLDGKTFLIVDGVLTLNNGSNKIVVNLSERPVSKVGEPALAGEGAVQALMAKSDCNTCHNRDVKTVGPAYIEIARRYDTSPQRKEELIRKILEGGSGNWGEVPMTAHPNLLTEDAATMVDYILALDAQEEADAAANKLMPKPSYEVKFIPVDLRQFDATKEHDGIAVNVYKFDELVSDFPEINDEVLPMVSGVVNAIHFNENDFGNLTDNFVVHASGFITMKETTNLVFRLVSDDGSKLWVDNKLVVDNGGNHGLDPRDGEIILKAGKHPFRIEYFQGGGGKGLSFQWRPHGSEEFIVVPPELFSFSGKDIKRTQEAPVAISKDLVPGDGSALVDVHPAFTLSQARPTDFKPKVGGMDFLSDGRLVVSTWDSLGSIYLLEGFSQGPDKIKVKRIAFGLAEPLGVKVVDDEIYVMQKQELTKLIDHDNDDVIDEYETICNGWRVSANFHEFAFGLLYKDGYFYGTLATAINPGGASTKPQIPDRGKAVKISKSDGSFSFVASGLRTPNGIGFGVDDEIYIADNQGDWLPASKIIHLQEGAWYGSRSVDFEGTANATETLPVVWLPQDEIGNSPSQPARLNVGPYKNQMIHGEVTHGGIKRVFAEKVNGQYQGAVFRFTQGLEAGVNRIVWGPDSALYIGGVGSTGNWGHYGKLDHGLQRLRYNGTSVFEMLAVHAQSDGIEIEFTEPLAKDAVKAENFNISQWWYQPTENYGGPKLDEQRLPVKSITASEDGKRVKLVLGNMKPRHVIYVRLNRSNVKSTSGSELWSTEAWYTMNSIPGKQIP